MFSVAEQDNAISFTISSDAHLIDRTLTMIRDFFLRAFAHKFSEAEVVIRELLNNALEHGNKNDPRKVIVCALELLENKRVKISITDQGTGFDTSRVMPGSPLTADQKRQRGYAIIHAYSDDVLFDSKGTSVTVYQSFIQKTVISVKKNSTGILITPEGDLTASVAQDLKNQLLEIIENETPLSITFNMEHVTSIDSICLSITLAFYKSMSEKIPFEKIRMVQLQKDIEQLFRIIHMEKIFSSQ